MKSYELFQCGTYILNKITMLSWPACYIMVVSLHMGQLHDCSASPNFFFFFKFKYPCCKFLIIVSFVKHIKMSNKKHKTESGNRAYQEHWENISLLLGGGPTDWGCWNIVLHCKKNGIPAVCHLVIPATHPTLVGWVLFICIFSPSPSTSKLGLSSMSPAAQRLASKHLGIQTSTDKALQASYTPSPSPSHRLPGTATPVSLTPISRRSRRSFHASPDVTAPASTLGTPSSDLNQETSLTDHLLNLPKRKRKSAADFFWHK